MDRIAVKEVGVSHQMEAYTYQGCDGYPAAKVFSPVYVQTIDGRSFFLPQGKRVQDEEGFTGYAYVYSDAERVAERVRQRGSIDPDFWVEVQERESLEDLWGPEAALREREDAMLSGW